MFYIASKIFWFIFQPTGFLIFLGFAGIILLWTRWKKSGRLAVTASVLGLMIVGLSPIGYMLLLPLEERFERVDLTKLGGPPTGIIVLGGVTDSTIAKARNSMTLNDRGERLTEAVVLAKRFPDARIVFSGGSGSIFSKYEPEAVSAGRYMEEMGVDKSRIILESKSRNTIENAKFSKQIINPKKGEKWLVITSAFHMSRSMGCFRTAGFDVYPWPVDYNTRGFREDIVKLPGVLSKGMLRTDIATKEWIGLVAYWLSGRTPELFPK